MFFVLSKVFWFLVQPLALILLALAAGFLALALNFTRTGLGLAGFSLLALAVVSLSPLGLLMMSVLENRIPRPDLPQNVAGIIVLGGAIDTRISGTRDEAELNHAADRLTSALALSRQYPDAQVVFTGGSAAVIGEGVPESVPARELFLSLGLEPERLLLEEESRNTYENALYTRRLVEPAEGETWLLVTSAYHMPRSLGCFRKAGFAVTPFPVDYQTPAGSAVWRPSAATIRNVEKVHFAIREYIGLFAYWLTDRTDALFPSV